MKVSDMSFREMYHTFFIMDISNCENYNAIKSCLKERGDSDKLLVYGYIDHEAGFTFEVLSTIEISVGGVAVLSGDESISIKLRRGSVADCDIFEAKEINTDCFKKYIEIMNDVYSVNEQIATTRNMEFLDECRNDDYPDDVMVVIVSDKNNPEGCWVRCEGVGEGCIKGILLNEPYQDFSVHAQDVIEFGITKTEDNKTLCVAVL